MKYQPIIIVSKNQNISDRELMNIVKNFLKSDFNSDRFDTYKINTPKNSIGIKDVIWINEKANIRSEGHKLFEIIGAEKLTPEAQNSLLRILEEPPTDVLVVLITNNSRALLETIRSRCVEISNVNVKLDNDTGAKSKAIADEIINGEFLQKIRIIDKIIEEDNNRGEALEIIKSLIQSELSSKRRATSLNILKRSYIGVKKGVNLKLVFSNIILNCFN